MCFQKQNDICRNNNVMIQMCLLINSRLQKYCTDDRAYCKELKRYIQL